MAGDVPAVASAVRLLERIARDWPEGVTSATLIDELGLNRSTCYNILGTLQRAGWTANRGDRAGWSLGPRLLTLARVSGDWVSEVVQRELDALSHRLGFIAFALQRHEPADYVVLARGDRSQGVRITVDVGETFPFSSPAIMRAFHAWSDPATVDRLADQHGIEAFTPETVTRRAALHEVFRQTRERGYAASIREYDLGQSGVSAPVFDAHGRVSMALCSLAFASELNESNVRRAGELVRDAGLRITERTGGVAPTA